MQWKKLLLDACFSFGPSVSSLKVGQSLKEQNEINPLRCHVVCTLSHLIFLCYEDNIVISILQIKNNTQRDKEVA